MFTKSLTLFLGFTYVFWQQSYSRLYFNVKKSDFMTESFLDNEFTFIVLMSSMFDNAFLPFYHQTSASKATNTKPKFIQISIIKFFSLQFTLKLAC